MADPSRVSGNRVYCHACNNEWERSQGGLQCTECGSEFVEIVDDTTRRSETPMMPQIPQPSPPPIPQHPIHGHINRSASSIPDHPLHNHYPWAPDPDESDITTFEFNTGRGARTISIRSTSYMVGGQRNRGGNDAATAEIAANFQSMLAGILGDQQHHRTQPGMHAGGFRFPNSHGDRGFGVQNHPVQLPQILSSIFGPIDGPGQQQRQMHPFGSFFQMLLNPGMAQHGDTVYTQEAFDRVMTQLMEQNQGNGAPPATDAAINSLRKKPVDAKMMGNDGTAECSICMDNVQLGDEVTSLPCNHWFHGDCVISWLKEHDTCPHCRQSINNANEANSPSSSGSRRRSSRRSSSMANPPTPPIQEETGRYGPQELYNSTGRREESSRYYHDSTRGSGSERPGNLRQRSSHSERRSDNSSNNNDNNHAGSGGFSSWLRRMPFT